VILKVKEIRALSNDELKGQLETAYEELFNCRLRVATKQLTNHREIPQTKKRIARIKTILKERELSLR